MSKRLQSTILCLYFLVTGTTSSLVRAAAHSRPEVRASLSLVGKSKVVHQPKTKALSPSPTTQKAKLAVSVKVNSSGVKKHTVKNKRRIVRSISKRKAKVFGFVARKMNYASKCKEEFVSAEGLGDWGRFVKDELSTGQYSELLKNDRAFKRICPGFRSMDSEQRQNLWVFILMSMSHYESSCRPNVTAQGPYGRTKGLLQLHEGAENRYAHWDRERICHKGDSRDPKGTLQCTLSMLNGQVEKFDSVFFQGSYWDVLRNVNDPKTHASKIRMAIQMLPDCRVRSLASAIGSIGKQNREVTPKYASLAKQKSQDSL